jgi:UDP-glucose 4-epimerase
LVNKTDYLENDDTVLHREIMRRNGEAVMQIEQLESNLKNQVVTITGGTGSFGKAMLRQLLNIDVKEIRIVSRDEEKHDSLRKSIPDERVKFIVGDVRDIKSMDRAFAGSDLLFHAAALKQVPTGEFFPLEVTKTNILGSSNVLESAIGTKIRHVVCLSTDKAVYPINAMGISKALMEKIAVSYARDNRAQETTISVTRYGNVICSRGSVIPRFVEQIRAGHAITITNGEMTRFLMSLDEAIDLVLYSFVEAEAGDICIRKAPAATIDVIARAVAKTLGVLKPDIRIIGTRHGEKLHESLLNEEEMAVAVDQGGYFKIPVDSRSLRYEPYFQEGRSRSLKISSYTSENTERLGVEEVSDLLMENYEYKEILNRR